MMIVGLALAGCPAEDDGETMGSEGSATAPTASSTMGETETSSDSNDASSTMPDQPAYGVPATTSGEATGSTGESNGGTGTDTDSDGATDTGTDSGGTSSDPTTGPSPLYGVAET
jgi:hypothetical protein